MNFKGIKFEEDQLPFLVAETFGDLRFVGVLSSKRVMDEFNEVTDEVRLKRVELYSELQGEVFNLDLPALADVDSFKYDDKVTIEGIEKITPWALRSDGSVLTGFNILANKLVLKTAAAASGNHQEKNKLSETVDKNKPQNN